MNVFKMMILILENVIALIAMTLAFVGLIYYGMSFFEERMKPIVTFTRVLSVIVTSCAALMLATKIPCYVSYLSLITNGLWCGVVFFQFPYISIIRPDFLLATICSTFLFAIFLVYGIAYSEDTMFVYLSYLFFHVLMIPILVTTCLSALDESTTNRTLEQERSIRNWFIRLFQRIGAKIPIRSRKKE